MADIGLCYVKIFLEFKDWYYVKHGIWNGLWIVWMEDEAFQVKRVGYEG